MARVTLVGNLSQYTGGVRQLELPATNVRNLMRLLAERFPDIGPHLDEGLAVAINGQIFQDALLEPIPADAEVHLLPQIAGG